jgi:hypothetical protein
MRAMAARVLTAAWSLLLTGARCAGAACAFTVDLPASADCGRQLLPAA